MSIPTEETLINDNSQIPTSRLASWWQHHLTAWKISHNRLWRDRLSTLTTLIVIGIALALPTSLFILLENAKTLSHGWEQGTQISLYLKTDLSAAKTQNLMARLGKEKEIASIKYISPAEGLTQLQSQPDLKNSLASLNFNPLPGVILLQPSSSIQSPAAIQAWLQQLQNFPEVDTAQLDMDWVNRLYALIDLGKHLVLALGILLAAGILFIIGNTIHLALQKYHQEIEVLKLIGATNSYIRRPFLYLGIGYGLFGSVVAICLVTLLMLWLAAPIHRLTDLYHSSFHLIGMSGLLAVKLLILGIVLGLVGAWIAIGKSLQMS